MACNKAPHTESGRDFQWIDQSEELSHSTRWVSTWLRTQWHNHCYPLQKVFVNQSNLFIQAVQWADSVQEERMDILWWLCFWHFSHYSAVDPYFLNDFRQCRQSAKYILNGIFILVPLSNNAPLMKENNKSFAKRPVTLISLIKGPFQFEANFICQY